MLKHSKSHNTLLELTDIFINIKQHHNVLCYGVSSYTVETDNMHYVLCSHTI